MTMECVRTRLENIQAWYKLRRSRNQTFRRWIATVEGRGFVRDAMRMADEARVRHLRRDFREWQPWQPGMPVMIGSGRRVHWCHISYLQYALICRLLHERLGWSGQRVRDAALLLQRVMDGGRLDIDSPLPTTEIFALAALPAGRYDEMFLTGERDGASPQETQWRLWISRVAAPTWGRYMLDHFVARLRRDPTYRTPSDIVGEVRRLRGATDVCDLRWCSGCQYLPVVAERPELHDWLLERASQATPCKVGDLDAMYVPFGLAYPADFDHVFQLGLDYEIRVRQSEWDALDHLARTNIVVGRAGTGFSMSREARA